MWPFKKKHTIGGTWQERLTPVVELMRTMEEAKNRMNEEEFSMFVKLQGRMIQGRARKARVACNMATIEDMEMEQCLRRSNEELDHIAKAVDADSRNEIPANTPPPL